MGGSRRWAMACTLADRSVAISRLQTIGCNQSVAIVYYEATGVWILAATQVRQIFRSEPTLAVCERVGPHLARIAMDRHHHSIITGWSYGRLSPLWICGLSIVGLAGMVVEPARALAQSSIAGSAAQAGENEARIQEWVEGLSSPEYATRRRAFLELWKQGSVALPAVRRALTTSDQQTISAAKVLENLLSLDISPTDNDELAELMQLSVSNWEAKLRSLGQKGYWQLASELLRNNNDLLTRVREMYPPDRFCHLIQIAFDQGDAFKAWPVVAQGLSPERRYYLTELTRKQVRQQFNGEVPEDIAISLDLVRDEAALPVDERALIYLYAGKTQQAWDIDPSSRVKQRIITYSGKWSWLKDSTVMSLLLGPSVNTKLRRAQLAAYSRLADDPAKSASTIETLRKELEAMEADQLKSSPELKQGELLKALILAGEGELVDDLVTRASWPAGTDYYTYRLQHEKVLKKFGFEEELANFEAWLQELPGKLNPSGPAAMAGVNSYDSYLELVMFLIHSGFAEQAQKLYLTLIDAVRRLPPKDTLAIWDGICDRADNNQLRKSLLTYLDENDKKLQQEERSIILSQLFTEWDNTVEKLWQYAPPEMTTSEGQSRRWQLMDRLYRYDRTLVEDDASTRLMDRWLTTALRESTKGESASDRSTTEIATLALRLGLRRQALAMVRQEATRNVFADVAEMLTANSSFESAGKWWESAISQVPFQHAWIRRYIDVLLFQGEAEAAAKYEASIWLRPLTNRMVEEDEITYLMVADDYFDEGEYDLAQQYAEVGVEMGEINERLTGWWARRLAQIAIEREDYATAARASRIFTLSLLMAGTTMPRLKIDTLQLYQYYAGQDLMCSAAADIQAGRIEQALQNILKFESLLPAGIESCEHCYPLLVKAGHQAEADQMLERCSQRMLKHLEAWPNDSNSHNNYAWMLARCNARIPEAIEHATKAVKLSDRSPTYVDTLAYAEFRAGNIDRAIELTRECVESDPRHAHFKKQLQRFRALK